MCHIQVKKEKGRGGGDKIAMGDECNTVLATTGIFEKGRIES